MSTWYHRSFSTTSTPSIGARSMLDQQKRGRWIGTAPAGSSRYGFTPKARVISASALMSILATFSAAKRTLKRRPKTCLISLIILTNSQKSPLWGSSKFRRPARTDDSPTHGKPPQTWISSSVGYRYLHSRMTSMVKSLTSFSSRTLGHRRLVTRFAAGFSSYEMATSGMMPIKS